MSICNIGCEFQEAGAGKLDCSDSDGNGIYGESECKTAAETLGFGITGSFTESTGYYPKGCYVYTYNNGDEKVFLNEHSTGLTNDMSPNLDKSTPICIITGNF